MLPPILRNVTLVKLLNVLVLPIKYVHSLFLTLKTDTDTVLNTAANVQYLEKALNDAFFLRRREIYITTVDEEKRRDFFLKREAQPTQYLYEKSESYPFVLWHSGESALRYNFTVHVPDFLCTSSAEDDKYKGRNLCKIRSILNRFKPAGRTYNIEIYEYE